MKLLRTSGSDWVTVRSATDRDGWRRTEDLAGTTTVGTCDFPRQSYSVVATFSWKGASSGEKTWRPNQAWGHILRLTADASVPH